MRSRLVFLVPFLAGGSSLVIAPRGPEVAGRSIGRRVANVEEHKQECTGLF
jgi:hypothetical protein